MKRRHIMNEAACTLSVMAQILRQFWHFPPPREHVAPWDGSPTIQSFSCQVRELTGSEPLAGCPRPRSMLAVFWRLRSLRTTAKRRLILPRRRSTAVSTHDRLHRRLSRSARGRTDLQGFADHPVDLLGLRRGGAIRASSRRGRSATPRFARRSNAIRRESPGLRRAQGLAAVDPEGRELGASHGGAVDARQWACKRR
jgi:hypothetical protein